LPKNIFITRFQYSTTSTVAIAHWTSFVKKIPVTVSSNFYMRQWKGCLSQLPIGRCQSPLILSIAIAPRPLPTCRCPSDVARQPLPVGHCPSAVARSAIAHSPLLIGRCPSPFTVAVYPSPLSFVKRNFLWRWDIEANFFLLSFVRIFSLRWDSKTFFLFVFCQHGDGSVEMG
jgi:hypothetical protein